MGNVQQTKEDTIVIKKDTILFAYTQSVLTLNSHIAFLTYDVGNIKSEKYRHRIITTRDLKFHMFHIDGNKVEFGKSCIQLHSKSKSLVFETGFMEDIEKNSKHHHGVCENTDDVNKFYLFGASFSYVKFYESEPMSV